MFAVLLLK